MYLRAKDDVNIYNAKRTTTIKHPNYQHRVFSKETGPDKCHPNDPKAHIGVCSKGRESRCEV